MELKISENQKTFATSFGVSDERFEEMQKEGYLAYHAVRIDSEMSGDDGTSKLDVVKLMVDKVKPTTPAEVFLLGVAFEHTHNNEREKEKAYHEKICTNPLRKLLG